MVEVDLVAEMAVFNPFDFFLEPEAETYPFAYEAHLRKDLQPFLETETPGPALSAFLAGIDRTPVHIVTFLVTLNQQLQQDIGYVIRMEPGVQSTEETLTKRTGSCRDSAWLLVQVLRHLGLAARFVSGYLIQLAPDVKSLDGPSGTEVDFTDLHAWTEVYLPGAGWIGFDPTSGLLASEGHIPLACTPDPVSAAPITGAVDECEVTFEHHMSVTRVYESPRVTKPYTDSQWQAIRTLGHEIDAELVAGDVRLTMGGEPTFISTLDMDAAEWNTAAVGPTKRHYAYELIMRLRDRFAPGGLLTFGQGKWYPGESLPRWAFALYWRKDEVAIWNDRNLIASEQIDHAPTIEDARVFAEALCERLEVDSDYLVDAYEDPWFYIHREGKLPPNVDPLDSKIEDAEERARLARVFTSGLAKPVGIVLPVQRWNAKSGAAWVTGPWPFRGDRMTILPGDSPLGFRLPIGSLPYIPPSAYPYATTTDPFDDHPPLPLDPDERRQPYRRGKEKAQAVGSGGGMQGQTLGKFRRAPKKIKDGYVSDSVRTALTIEPRNGRLCIFLPPVERTEDFLEMIAAIEDTAAELATPIHLEGYSPPPDPRINVIRVTPDPGVIEVNIHPAASWDELVHTTTAIYEEARQVRLGSEKFMVDGRHVGTGGGNHLVLGGASPSDSPFLRRPDMMGSLIRYWQNHPSLSYLFSGLFIGPTSQHPRVDEGRDDTLYELEIALRELPPKGFVCPPWLVDRVLRNILVDVTGNTHRTELSIDKLYSPDGPTGRLGLVEFRAFEMPPHAEMSCAQQLLLRALVAWFWNRPYTNPLIRWGNSLRDRFMLPHFIGKDFDDVLNDLRSAGYGFDPSWFAPHFEFRFPRHGEVNYQGVSIEVRHALEPWHVLGEEQGGGGTVRFVDSSVERLQIKVQGLYGDRFAVTCNGNRIPLNPTGVSGEFVAGVRYRAWHPSSCLHPTIGVHTPLIFDLVDLWTGRSLGGCTYHVAHPGGRNYDSFPVNAYEAESRRLARFYPYGHTPGPLTPRYSTIHPDFPFTLDLRLQ